MGRTLLYIWKYVIVVECLCQPLTAGSIFLVPKIGMLPYCCGKKVCVLVCPYIIMSICGTVWVLKLSHCGHMTSKLSQGRPFPSQYWKQLVETGLLRYMLVLFLYNLLFLPFTLSLADLHQMYSNRGYRHPQNNCSTEALFLAYCSLRPHMPYYTLVGTRPLSIYLTPYLACCAICFIRVLMKR